MFLLFLSLVIIFVIGYSISAYFLGDMAEKIEIIPMGFIVGFIIMGYFILFASFLTGNFANAVWAFMALGGVYSGYYGLVNYGRLKNYLNIKKFNADNLMEKFKELPWLEVIFFLIFIAFFFDVFSKTIFYEEGVYKVAAAGYGDIPFHMSQVSYFIHNNPFALEEPIYSGTKLVYAFLINLISGAFYILSGNYILSFNLPSHILLFTGFFFVYRFISTLIKTSMMRILAFFVFFLGTGAESIKVFSDPALWGQGSIGKMIDYLLHLPYPIVNIYNAVYPIQNNIWSGFMTMFLMHQRSFFFGFAAGSMILYIFILALKNNSKKYFYFIGLMLGFLPLVHMHTFIALSVVFIGFYVWKFFIREKDIARNLIRMIGLGAVIGSLISYFFILDSSSGASLLTFRIGWMSIPGGIGAIQYGSQGVSGVRDWILYQWENFGLFFPLLAISIAYFIFRIKNFLQNKDQIFGLIFGVIFLYIIINTVQFQPWDFDNGKIFGYVYLLGIILILYFFEQWKFKLGKSIAVILAIIMISTGLIDGLARSSYAKPATYEIFGVKEQKAADWIVNNTLSGEMILTGTSHLNPVDSLAGRPVLVGYPGWLWSHGIKYGEREKAVFEIYRNGKETKRLVEKYGIRYIYVGPAERSISDFKEQLFTENYPVVFQEGGVKIYKVR